MDSVMHSRSSEPPRLPVRWGTRLPNIVSVDADGRRFEYQRDIVRGPTLFLASPTAAIQSEARAVGGERLNIIAIDGERGEGRWIADPEGIARKALFGASDAQGLGLLADANQRFVAAFIAEEDFGKDLAEAVAMLQRPDVTERRSTAPVMLVPRLFETELCQVLIDAFEADHQEGMVSVTRLDGRAGLTTLPDKKKRRDRTLDRQEPLYAAIRTALAGRLMPELWKAWWVEKLRTEAFYTACYEAGRGDFFAAHRDNTLPHTARRRIAVSVELNDDYEGGGLVFPEYGEDRWRAPAGGGLVFSCSLMHEAVPVTKGRRYVLLAFLTE